MTETSATASVSFSDLDESLGHLIRRGQRVHTAIWASRVYAGLTSAQYAVLTVVAGYPQSSQGALGDVASLDKSTTADVVSRLTRHGWLRPEVEAGRTRAHALTPPAEVALGVITDQVCAVQDELLAPLPEAARGELIDLLVRIAYPDGDPVPPPPADGVPVLGCAEGVGHLLRRAERRSQRIWASIVGREVTAAQYAVFCAIRNERLDQRTIAALASIDTSNAGDVVARLGERGLVSVERPESDRRRTLVALTPAAFELLRDLTPKAEAVHRELRSPLPKAGADRLRDLMHLLAYRR
ncbi:MAG: MarR family transcriptional regulator [Naasia sp.]|nr:MarR family transcriptional regulator [Naasia sp.]